MQKPNPSSKNLKSNPFKNSLRGVRVGPTCLKCDGPIVRVKGQRQGWLHEDCEEKVAKDYREEESMKLFPPGAKKVLYVERAEDGNLELFNSSAYVAEEESMRQDPFYTAEHWLPTPAKVA